MIVTNHIYTRHSKIECTHACTRPVADVCVQNTIHLDYYQCTRMNASIQIYSYIYTHEPFNQATQKVKKDARAHPSIMGALYKYNGGHYLL